MVVPATKDILNLKHCMTPLKKFRDTLTRHWSAFVFIFTIVLPVILRTRRRPVIFSRWSGLGDIICTFPAAMELKKRNHGATFIYNCHPDFADMPLMAGVADYCTHCLHVNIAGYWYPFLFAGFYHFAHRDDIVGQTSKEPMVTEFCRQFDLPILVEHPHIIPSLPKLERVKVLLKMKNLDAKNLIVIHSGPSWPVREWSLEKWAGLVAGLRQHGFTNIAQLGVGNYLNFGTVKIECIPGATSLVNELSLEQACAVISLAKLHVGIDSGLLHVAAAMGTPGVGIFGMTSPKTRFSPTYIHSFVVSRVDCQGCYHRLPRIDWITGCPNDIKCMKEISVEDVLRVCLKQLRLG